MSTGHTPMYTSAVSTLVRSHGAAAPSPPETCRRLQPPSAAVIAVICCPFTTLYLCLGDICVHMIISISISQIDVNCLYLLDFFFSSNFTKAVRTEQPFSLRVRPGHSGTSRWQCSAVQTDAHNLGNNAARLMRPDDRGGGAHWSNEEVAKL